MPDTPTAIDTGVLIALAAATGSWEILNILNTNFIVPSEVLAEVRACSPIKPGVQTPLASCMYEWPNPIDIPVWMAKSLDPGERAVISLALSQKWQTVAIDEKKGCRIAQDKGLRLTGSLGLMIAAKRAGYPI